MKRRVLGRTGLRVPVVGFGGIPVQRLSDSEAQQVIRSAVDAGIDFIDTARGYTDSEKKIGRALAGRRGEVVLASKSMARDADGMRREIEASLRDLGTDVIDLYQLHNVATLEQLQTVMGRGGACEALEEAREQGKVRFVGVTGHSRAVLLKAVETDRFDTVQLPFNPIESEALEDVIPAARRRDVGIIGMKPVAGGALASVASAALRYNLEHGVDVVIPGIDSLSQVHQNAYVGVDFRSCAPEELAALEKEKTAWGKRFCRRCGYCSPCPHGLNINMLFLIQAYYERYDLKEWALERLSGLDKHYGDCRQCGECLPRCPYELDIPQMMQRFAAQVR